MIAQAVSKHLLPGALALMSLSAIFAARAAEAPTGFYITSTTFSDGGTLPTRTAYTKTPNFPNCVGQNISPQLSWAKPYAGVKSYALVMIDLEDIQNDTDLVVYGIPGSVTSFAEGELRKPSDKFVSGRGSRGDPTWRGMCPPPGMAPHHYAFIVRGTDLYPKELPPGLNMAELDAKLKGHIRGQAAIVGKFVRPQQ